MTTTEKLVIKITANDKVLVEDFADYRTFKSGKKGYGLYGKLVDVKAGKRFQMSINIVEIEPKS